MPGEFNDDYSTAHCPTTNASLGNDSLAIAPRADASLELIVFKLSLQVLIALFGVAGNLLVVIVIGRMGKKKQPGDFYLQNLAIGDLGTLLLTFPRFTIKTWFDWPFGQFTCRYVYPIPEIFYGGSVWFIAVIAIERYRKVVTVKPMIKRKNKTLLQRAKAVAACVWAISFVVFCFPLFFVVEYREPPGWCGPVWPEWDRNSVLSGIYIGSLTLFSYILPLTIISVTCLFITRKINETDGFIKAMKQEELERGHEGECTSLANVKSVRLSHNKRVKKILTPLVIVFAVTMLPLNVLRLIIVLWPAIVQREYYGKLLYTISLFVILNSSANPVIYSVVSKEFRKAINNLFLSLCQPANYLNFKVFMIRSRSRPRNTGEELTPC